MEDFPDSVDAVIYGTGVAESIISASFSLCGKKVLHLDRFSQYGGTEASVRFDSLIEFLENSSKNKSSDGNLFKTTHTYDYVRQVSYQWHITLDNRSSSPQPGATSNSQNTPTYSTLLKELARVEIDIMPKIIKARSILIDAILRSDVSRYLEFTFVKSLYALKSGTKDIIKIPQTRSDVFDSDVLTLIQKRKLTKFLEFCLKYRRDDIANQGLQTRTLKDVLSNDYKMDNFLVDTIVNTFTMSSPSVLFEEGMKKLNDILHSVNRFGPYPILVPLYGTSDVGQGFCRMSAVFGATFCLDCHIVKCTPAPAGKTQSHPLLVELSNGKTVRTDVVISAPGNLAQVDTWANIKWMARAIYILKGSVYASLTTKDSYESSLLVVPRSGADSPFIIIENGMRKISGHGNFFVVHVLAPVSASSDPKTIIVPVEDILFSHLAQNVERILSIYFNIPDYSKSAMKSPLPKGIHILPGFTNDIDLDDEVKQAERLFKTLYPTDTFLSPPPKPEDIILSEDNHNAEVADDTALSPPKPEDIILSEDNHNADAVENNETTTSVRSNE